MSSNSNNHRADLSRFETMFGIFATVSMICITVAGCLAIVGMWYSVDVPDAQPDVQPIVEPAAPAVEPIVEPVVKPLPPVPTQPEVDPKEYEPQEPPIEYERRKPWMEPTQKKSPDFSQFQDVMRVAAPFAERMDDDSRDSLMVVLLTASERMDSFQIVDMDDVGRYINEHRPVTVETTEFLMVFQNYIRKSDPMSWEDSSLFLKAIAQTVSRSN